MCNSDTRCPVRIVAGVLLLIVARGVDACDPSLHVDLGGDDPAWNHLGCPFGVDATATGGTVDNYNYYYFSPYTAISSCSSPPSCGGPPPTSVLFPSVGEYTVCVSVSQNDPYDWAMDDQHVFVVATDISADSTYVAVNDDDDDGDGNMDLAQVTPGSSTITGEDDLVQIHLSFTSPGGYRELGKVRLSVGGAYPHVKIWSSSTRGTCLIHGGGSYEWDAGSQPSSVWIEGLTATNDCEVWIQYVDYYGGPHQICPNPEINFTVVHADMDLAGVDDDPTGGGATTTEEITPGGCISLGDVASLTIKPVQPSSLSRAVTLGATGGGSKIRVWADQQKTQSISLPHTFSPTSNTTFYVEGYQVSSSLRDITLTLTHTQTGFQDNVNLTVMGLEKIQYRIGSDAYQDCPNPLAVAKGADVTFKAMRNPAAAPWPTGKPVWSGNSGASGTGEEEEVAFNTASSSPTDYKVVQAECGNTVSVNVVVVDLSTLEINANRTSTPVESSFPVKLSEHFELGGTFQFDLMLNTWPTPVKLGAEIWDRDFVDEIIASGSGASISHTFGTGGHDDGACKTRFHFDNNTSGDSYTGVDDPYKDSLGFRAQALTTHSLSFAYSSVLGGVSVSSACSDATSLILAKDTSDDYRATANMQSSGVTQVSAGGHDPVDMEWIYTTPPEGYVVDTWGHMQYFDSATSADVVLVSDIRPCNSSGVPYTTFDVPGFATMGTKYDIFLQYSSFDGHVLAHELGHNCGLSHCETIPANVDRVMYYSTIGNETLLVPSEVDNYE